MWPNDRFVKLSGTELPIIQAPMAGAAVSDMVVAVSEVGGLGSLACAVLSAEQARKELETTRRHAKLHHYPTIPPSFPSLLLL